MNSAKQNSKHQLLPIYGKRKILKITCLFLSVLYHYKNQIYGITPTKLMTNNIYSNLLRDFTFVIKFKRIFNPNYS